MTRDHAWDTDQTLLCERLAERLRHRGYAHPVAAAVALAVRGSRGIDPATFARQLGVDLAVVESIDAGDVPLDELPPPVLLVARHQLAIDLDRLATLASGDG